jgi:hypothetical protein
MPGLPRRRRDFHHHNALKPPTVPAHDRVRPDDGDRIQYARPKPIKQDEQQSVQRLQADALRRRTAQDDELLSKDEDLDL